jgi:hypothetical protein
MNRFTILIFCLVLLSGTLLRAEDTYYLENVRFEPDHREMNIDGEIDIYFNLPDHTKVKKAVLSVKIGASDVTLKEIEGSKLGYLNNKMSVKGLELLERLKSQTGFNTFRRFFNDDEFNDGDHEVNDELYDEDETPDEDYYENTDTDQELDDADSPDTFSDYDGIYTFTLTIHLDNSSTDDDDDNESIGIIEEEEEEEEETNTSTIPSSVSESFEIIYDNIAPEAPIDIKTEGGDKRIVLKITPPYISGSTETHEKIGKYHISLSGLFHRDGDEIESTVKYVSSVKENYDKIFEVSISGKDGLELINNDEGIDKYLYTIEISAEDAAGNHNPDKFIQIEGSAITTFGFWSHYKSEGGDEKGGFCFIASSGFGSYNNKYLKILRNFRDFYLNNFYLGKKIIRGYYSLGHYPADLMDDYPVIKPLVKAILFPFVIFAWLLTDIAGIMITALWFISLMILIFRKKLHLFLPLFLFVLILSSPSEIKAIGGEFSFSNSFYYPSIDKGMESKPFETIGGTKKRYLPSVNFGFQIPLLDQYIRWSVVGGGGFTRFKGTSIKADGEKSPDSTAFYFIPLTGEIKIRPEYSFPVWPYGSFGMDYVIWWIREKDDTSKYGGTFGFHGSLGLMLSLNWLEPGSSKKLKHSTGIENTALFAHFRMEKIDNFGKENSFDLSSHRFEFGIIFEF